MKKLFFFLTITSLFFIQCKNNENLNLNTNDLDFIGTGAGCGSFFVYKLNNDNTIGLTVRGNRDSLSLSTDKQTFDLTNQDNLFVNIHSLNNGDNFYCDDVVEIDEEILNNYEGLSGLISIQITEDSIDFNGQINPFEVFFKVNVELENIQLKDENGDELMIESEVFSEVFVGWLPG